MEWRLSCEFYPVLAGKGGAKLSVCVADAALDHPAAHGESFWLAVWQARRETRAR